MSLQVQLPQLIFSLAPPFPPPGVRAQPSPEKSACPGHCPLVILAPPTSEFSLPLPPPYDYLTDSLAVRLGAAPDLRGRHNDCLRIPMPLPLKRGNYSVQFLQLLLFRRLILIINNSGYHKLDLFSCIESCFMPNKLRIAEDKSYFVGPSCPVGDNMVFGQWNV